MLIKCPECGHKVSDTAKACPKCGFPIADYVEKHKNSASEKQSSDSSEKATTYKGERNRSQETVLAISILAILVGGFALAHIHSDHSDDSSLYEATYSSATQEPNNLESIETSSESSEQTEEMKESDSRDIPDYYLQKDSDTLDEPKYHFLEIPTIATPVQALPNEKIMYAGSDNADDQDLPTHTYFYYVSDNAEFAQNIYKKYVDTLSQYKKIQIEQATDQGNAYINSEDKMAIVGIMKKDESNKRYLVITLEAPKDSTNSDKNATSQTATSDSIAVEVAKAHQAALDLNVRDCIKDGDHLYYHDLIIVSEDMEFVNAFYNKNGEISQGALYRSIAKALEGFEGIYESSKDIYGIWADDEFTQLLFGIDKPDDIETMKKYVDNIMDFFTVSGDSGRLILKRLKKSPYCQGNIYTGADDFYNSDFEITDLNGLANELGITGEALGYVLADLDEYVLRSTFSGNTCHIHG